MQDTHNLKEVCSWLGVSRNRVEQWIARGYLKMNNDVVPGGTRKVTFRDAMVIAVMARLADLNMPKSALMAVGYIHTYRQGAFLVISDGGTHPRMSDPDEPPLIGRTVPADKLNDYLDNSRHELFIVLNLDDIEARVRSAWERAE